MNNDLDTKAAARVLLGAFFLTAGIAHFTFARKAFRAQVPDWVPLKKDETVLISGAAEIVLGAALITPGKHVPTAGKAAAVFLAAVFPGNISQFLHHRDMPGLDTDRKRFVRLFFQPLMMYWAVKSTEKR